MYYKSLVIFSNFTPPIITFPNKYQNYYTIYYKANEMYLIPVTNYNIAHCLYHMSCKNNKFL